MTAEQLAKAAFASTAPHRASVSDTINRELELAYIARWIDTQDSSIAADRVLSTARSAIEILRNLRGRLR